MPKEVKKQTEELKHLESYQVSGLATDVSRVLNKFGLPFFSSDIRSSLEWMVMLLPASRLVGLVIPSASGCHPTRSNLAVHSNGSI